MNIHTGSLKGRKDQQAKKGPGLQRGVQVMNGKPGPDQWLENHEGTFKNIQKNVHPSSRSEVKSGTVLESSWEVLMKTLQGKGPRPSGFYHHTC